MDKVRVGIACSIGEARRVEARRVGESMIASHMQVQHPSISKEDRIHIVQMAQTVPQLAQQPEEVQYPLPDSRPVEGLPVFRDALQCALQSRDSACNYACREPKGMAKHCREQHQWKNPRKRGRYPHIRQHDDTRMIPPWRAKQAVQQFFKTGKWQRYFPVQVDNQLSNEQTEGVPNPEQIIQQGKTILERFKIGFKRAREGDTSNQQRRRCEPNPWLEHTMWESHIGPYREWAVKMIKENGMARSGTSELQPEVEEGEEFNDEEASAVTASEEALEQACKATRSLIRRAYQVSRVEIVGRPAMLYINRRETGAVSSDRPFYGKQKVQTIRKYSDQFVQILRYIWRTEAIEKRPKYHLTIRQQDELGALRTKAAKIAQKAKTTPSSEQQERQAHRRGQLINQCSSFWIAMFDHQLGDQEYESAILSGLAVLGADGIDGSWVPAINYTPKLAAVITTMRAIVIRKAWRTRQDEIQRKVRNGIPESRAREGAQRVLDMVKEDVHRFMTTMEFGGHPTPLNTIYIHKMYGMKIRYTTKAEGQITWEGNDTVLVRKIKFSMDDIRKVVHGLLSNVRTQLVEELCVLPVGERPGEWKPEELPQFNIAKISDNHRVLDEGWNFLKDIRNEWPVDGETWMGMRLFREGAVRERFIQRQDNTSVEWKTDAINRYLRAIKKFKERLIVLVHMSAGAPARSTELTSIQCENGKYARSQRGLFIDNGLVAFVTAYHKGFSASQSMKIIHRFVPREVGEVVVYYMWLIRPFEQILQRALQDQRLFSSWFWEPEPEAEWEADEDEEVDDQEDGYVSEEGEEVRGSREMPVEEWDDVEHNEEAAEVREQAMPNPEARNCDGYWDTNRVRRVMRRETANLCGVAIGISDWRQVYPAIHREFTMDHNIQETLTKIYENQNPNAKADDPAVGGSPFAIFRARQAGHSQQIEENIYGRLLDQSPVTTTAEKDAFRSVSVDWHRFLHFPSALEVDAIDPDIRRRVKMEQEDARFRRFQQMRTIDVEAELRRMYNNPKAQFRGAQREALDLIVGGRPRAVIVMRTGGGKSLLFMLPAAASKEGVTIVVVPKIALQSNMKQRCIEAGIPCAVWSEDRAPPYDARIVFVIAESAVSASFADYINAKKANHQLERIVIDECHTILQSHQEWRPQVLQLRELAGRDTQVVCLTATLPPKRQDEFLEKMDMQVPRLAILRDSTVRPNIAYSVEEYDANDEVEFLRRLVEQKKAQYPTSDKIVIYCRNIQQVKDFAHELGYTAFWRTVGTEDEKAEVLKQLTSGTERVFTSTNALGEGIDAPGVRVVIHIGVIDSLDDYGQQSGRAGRDGRTASEAIILRKVKIGKDGRRRPEQGWKVEPEMKEFWSGRKCKRVVMDAYMDGDTERTACRPGEQFCDVCRGRGQKRVRVGNEQEERASKRMNRSGGSVQSIDDSGIEVVDVEGEPATQVEGQAIRIEGQAIRIEGQAIRIEGQAIRIEEQAIQIEEQATQSEEQDRQQWTQEKRQFAAIEEQHREERITQGQVVDQMDALFREWKHGCSVCRIRERPSNTGHSWRNCPHERVDVGVIERVRGILCQVRWSNGWMCCTSCWAPQAICHSYKPIDNTGRMRFRKVPNTPCQYRGVLLEAISVLWAVHPESEQMVEWIRKKAHQANTTIQQTSEDRDDIIQAWFGSNVNRGSMDMSGMCDVFYEVGRCIPTC
nr:atp-dependent dna helicase tlh1 [Quercus suber]